MATTVGIVNDLFEKTIADVSQNAEHWQSFLKTANNLPKRGRNREKIGGEEGALHV